VSQGRPHDIGFEAYACMEGLIAIERSAPLNPVRLLAAGGLQRARAQRLRCPMFLVGFAALVALNSTRRNAEVQKSASPTRFRAGLVAAIAAPGTKTSFKGRFGVGWRPIGLMIAETL